MKIKIILMIMLILLIPTVLAVESLGVFKLNQNIDLMQTCSNCSSVNITSVLYPNSTIMIENKIMTKDGTKYNYALNSSYVTVPGQYIVNGVGDLNGENKVWSYNFDVNPTGRIETSILNNPMLIILGLIGLGLVIFGAAKGIPWFGFIGSIMFLLLGVYTMIYGFNNITSMYTRGVSITILGMGIIFMFASAYEWVFGGEEEGD